MCLALLARVVAVTGGGTERTATLVADDGAFAASLLLCPDVRPGDHVLVHTGYVVERLPPDLAADAARLRGTVETADPRSC